MTTKHAEGIFNNDDSDIQFHGLFSIICICKHSSIQILEISISMSPHRFSLFSGVMSCIVLMGTVPRSTLA
jgi:hypothetical protein